MFCIEKLIKCIIGLPVILIFLIFHNRKFFKLFNLSFLNIYFVLFSFIYFTRYFL